MEIATFGLILPRTIAIQLRCRGHSRKRRSSYNHWPRFFGRRFSVAHLLQRPILNAMFAGLVEEIGEVLWIRASEKKTQLQIVAPQMAKKVRTGDSISANGCCLTVS